MKIPILLPAKPLSGSGPGQGLMLCQIEGSGAVTQGESGAIGRLSVGADGALKLDLKGRIYAGGIYPSHTALIISNPMKQAARSSSGTSGSKAAEGDSQDIDGNILSQSISRSNSNVSNAGNNSDGEGDGENAPSPRKRSGRQEAKVKGITNQICIFQLENDGSSFDRIEGDQSIRGDLAGSSVGGGGAGGGGSGAAGAGEAAGQAARNRKNKESINISSNVQRKKPKKK